MYESFIYSVNTVIPIFILVILGYIVRKTGFLSGAFIDGSDRVVFHMALPAMLFTEIVSAAADSDGAGFDLGFTLFCVIGILAVFLIALAVTPFIVKSNPQRGSMIQAVYRSNFAILGIPLAQNMFGDAGVRQIAMVMPFCIALFNALAVINFSVFAPEDKKLPPLKIVKNIAVSIAKNPLVLSIVAAVLVSFLPFSLPVIISKPLDYLGDLTLPLALLSLGSNFKYSDLRGGLALSLTATAIKIVVVPLAAVAVAIVMGFRGVELGVVFILFGGPSAVSGYIMAKNMGGDYTLTGQITLMTTFACMFTIFGGVFALKLAELI
jgi:Predicted permeases